ncbi:putative dTDP-D-glucose 4 [Tieghemostelium lacteum]|uniref:Putative dTDP-D-glucose 4 n=1 Tax=Tieghemostelium lacteum TaxID=361077 RepID=A0A152A363_TIELA|nr:putative dTDP-D-glucose 4 [Tieghemostelium lacteum]|eukprot:KYR00649.1 putative dTDP-D-glucose 4 [Tieghemostelium lacteum]
MQSNNNILITGGQGFIGSWICRILVRENNFKVIVVDVKPDYHILEQIMEPEEIKKIDFSFIDITNTADFKELVLKYEPKFIIHLAGLQIPTCKANPILGANVNVLGTINVFESVKELKERTSRVCPVIYASSVAVNGPSEDYQGVVTAQDHQRPMTMYGVYKLANEGTARVYWNDHKIPSVALRPYTVYGVGREFGLTSSPTKLLKSIIFGQNYTIPFQGRLNVNYVEDIANLFIDLGRVNQLQGAHVCNIKGDSLDIKDWVSMVKQILPTLTNKIEIQIQGSPLPFPDEFSEEVLEEILQTKPIKTTPPLEGIKKTVAIFQTLYQQNKLSKSDL